MEPVTIFGLVLGLFIFLMVAGAPIFAALGVASVLGIAMQSGFSGLTVVSEVLHRGLASYSLISIPLFILMGEVIARTSIGGKLFKLFLVWMNRVPGNLAVASVGSSAVFGAMSGVSVAGLMTTVQPAASAGAIFRVAIASGKFHGVMKKHGPTGRCVTIIRPVPSGLGP